MHEFAFPTFTHFVCAWIFEALHAEGGYHSLVDVIFKIFRKEIRCKQTKTTIFCDFCLVCPSKRGGGAGGGGGGVPNINFYQVVQKTNSAKFLLYLHTIFHRITCRNVPACSDSKIFHLTTKKFDNENSWFYHFWGTYQTQIANNCFTNFFAVENFCAALTDHIAYALDTALRA